MSPLSVFPSLRAVIFDMDGTLYRNRRLDKIYQRSFYRMIAERQAVSEPEARARFLTAQAQLKAKLKTHPAMLATLITMGISDRSWAKTYGRMKVKKYLRPNPRLRQALRQLAERFRLGLVTDNHRWNTEQTLQALGIADVFDESITLSESRRLKPAPEIYSRMASCLAVDPSECLSIGDRYDLDLAPAAQVGMQTLLIQDPKDIYALPQVIQPKPAKYLRVITNAQKQAAVTTAVRSLQAGQLVVLPTDTIYGMSALPVTKAIRWLYRAKSRPADNPIVILLSDLHQVEKYARVSVYAKKIMKKYWPGALTLVLPIKPGTPWGKLTHGQGTVALRVPNHELARQIIQQSGGALATTSANCSGCPAPQSVEQLDKKILCFAEWVIDAGKTPSACPSTVAKIMGNKSKILRPGRISKADLQI